VREMIDDRQAVREANKRQDCDGTMAGLLLLAITAVMFFVVGFWLRGAML